MFHNGLGRTVAQLLQQLSMVSTASEWWSRLSIDDADRTDALDELLCWGAQALDAVTKYVLGLRGLGFAFSTGCHTV